MAVPEILVSGFLPTQSSSRVRAKRHTARETGRLCALPRPSVEKRLSLISTPGLLASHIKKVCAPSYMETFGQNLHQLLHSTTFVVQFPLICYQHPMGLADSSCETQVLLANYWGSRQVWDRYYMYYSLSTVLHRAARINIFGASQRPDGFPRSGSRKNKDGIKKYI